jgi:hypothetical protein
MITSRSRLPGAHGSTCVCPSIATSATAARLSTGSTSNRSTRMREAGTPADCSAFSATATNASGPQTKASLSLYGRSSSLSASAVGTPRSLSSQWMTGIIPSSRAPKMTDSASRLA